MTVSFHPDRDHDYYAFSTDESFAEAKWRFAIDENDAGELELCLTNGQGDSLTCRRGATPFLPDLVLTPGDYGIHVQNISNLPGAYTLRFETTGTPSPNVESEPNDLQAMASPLNAENRLSGRAVGREDDFLSFVVEGDPELWRIQAIGDGLEYIVLLDGAGRVIQQRDAEADGRARLDNLYLLPGQHWLRLRGADADYAVYARPFGPPADSPAADEVVAELLSVESTGPTTDLPTFPVTEREPNDDESRAHLLRFGVAQSGTLTVPEDRDLYRFFLGAEDYIRLSVTSPLDGIVDLDVHPYFTNAQPAPGETQAIDLLLPPGDHAVQLRGAEPGETPYRILLERLDPLTLPLDLEPTNNVQTGAQEVIDACSNRRLHALRRRRGLVQAARSSGVSTSY